MTTVCTVLTQHHRRSARDNNIFFFSKSFYFLDLLLAYDYNTIWLLSAHYPGYSYKYFSHSLFCISSAQNGSMANLQSGECKKEIHTHHNKMGTNFDVIFRFLFGRFHHRKGILSDFSSIGVVYNSFLSLPFVFLLAL